MSVAVQIDITKDTARPALKAAREFMLPARLNPIVGRSAVNVYRAHFFGLNETRPNKLGGTRTNYYASAARQTHFTVLNDDSVLISIPQIGIRQRFYGGKIRPVTKKYLTEPATAAAYGHRASEFDLELVFGKGGEPYALALTRNRGRDRAAAGLGRSHSPVEKPVIMFWLKKEVSQKPDPTILPYDEQVLDRVNNDVKSALERDIARAQQQSGNGGAS